MLIIHADSFILRIGLAAKGTAYEAEGFDLKPVSTHDDSTLNPDPQPKQLESVKGALDGPNVEAAVAINVPSADEKTVDPTAAAIEAPFFPSFSSRKLSTKGTEDADDLDSIPDINMD